MRSATLVLLLVALGLGSFSATSFAWHWVAGPPGPVSLAGLSAIVAVASGILFVHLRRRVRATATGAWLLHLLFLPAFGHGFFWMVQGAKAQPHGHWDGWAIWNLHARFLHRGEGDLWRNLFSAELSWSHPDYPKLVPGLVSASWSLVGSETTVIPAAFSVGFAALTIAILWAAVSHRTGDARGPMAGLLLLGTPGFLLQSSGQMADVPLAMFMLATLVFLQLSEASPEAGPLLGALGGFSAGLAAWTKNEGLLFVLVLSAAGVTFALLRHDRPSWRLWAGFGVGLVPPLALVLAFRRNLAPSSELLSQADLTSLLDVDRYRVIASAFLGRLGSFGDLWDGLHPGILVAIFVLLHVRRVRGGFTPIRMTLLSVPPLLVAGYFMVYVITPFDLAWHLATSLDRVLLQVWPATVFVVATALPARAPIEPPAPPWTAAAT